MIAKRVTTLLAALALTRHPRHRNAESPAAR
jgi:hypothetical protein